MLFVVVGHYKTPTNANRGLYGAWLGFCVCDLDGKNTFDQKPLTFCSLYCNIHADDK